MGFCLSRKTSGQIFALAELLKETWEFGRLVYQLSVDLEKAYGCTIQR